jgi:tRNA-specific 2-thiouridylase
MSSSGKVVVAMSGGVDSSVAASLLKEQGYDCVGVFMRVGATEEGTQARRHAGTQDGHEVVAVPTFPASHVPTPHRHGCCSVEDALDARNVATRLGIPFYVLNFAADFGEIIDYFVDEYAHARTPNPCVLCNIHLKFGKLLRYADMLDAEFVATGHYARILRGNGATQTAYLARARNLAKDQSYVLFGIQRDDLRRCLFPLGEIADKAEVRRIAAGLGLKVHDKPDSQEICFVPDGDYKPLVRARRPETQRPGPVLDADGRELGTHEGVANFTIGQRRGLRIATGQPIYVTELDPENNVVRVGPQAALASVGLIAERVNWLVDPPADGEWRPAAIRIRHRHTAAAGHIRAIGKRVPGETTDGVEARFDVPQLAVTPGQAAVFYDADEIVLGGGWIASGVANSE